VVIEVTEPVDEVVLNAAELEMDDAWLEPAGGEPRRTATVTLEESTERARLSLDQPLEPGTWVLHSRFRGTLNDKLTGFYRSTFTDEADEDQVIAVTQFEATHARRAFPCWDEPELKAVFSVTLVVADDLTAVSNAGEISNETAGDGRKRVTFADTMKMSTYLVCFVVGKLEATEAVDVDGTPLRIVFVPGKRHLAEFALEVGAFTLRFFANYYGIPYPGDKLDMIALPDFAAGAMENLGAITYPRRPCWWTPTRPRTPTSSASRTSSRTRSRTCGSAIW